MPSRQAVEASLVGQQRNVIRRWHASCLRETSCFAAAGPAAASATTNATFTRRYKDEKEPEREEAVALEGYSRQEVREEYDHLFNSIAPRESDSGKTAKTQHRDTERQDARRSDAIIRVRGTQVQAGCTTTTVDGRKVVYLERTQVFGLPGSLINEEDAVFGTTVRGGPLLREML